MSKKNATLLVTGGGGYLGSVMVPLLLAQGYAVRVLDRFFWGKQTLPATDSNNQLTLIEADTRSYPAEHLAGVEAVIDLAALSNDPIGELDPKTTLAINHQARVRTATLAKQAGVQKYILASSCSIYGFQDGLLDETTPPEPVTTYARASLLAEQGVLPLADNNFSVTVLRQGTLYGLSPRMRFDLLLNTMTLSLVRQHAITVQDGEQWRPIIHVADSADAFINIVVAQPKLVNGQIFNVGTTDQNFQIKALAKLLQEAIDPTADIVTQEAQRDFRSYRVAFEKIYDALRQQKITDGIETRTIDWYKHLLSQDPTLLTDLKK